MNICFLLPPTERYSPVSGSAVSTRTMQIGRRLLARGHDVTVLAPANDDPPYPVGRLAPIHCRTRHTLSLPQRGISHWRKKLKRWDWPYYEYYLSSARRELRQLGRRPDALLVFNDLITPRHLKRELPQARLLCMLSRECRTNQKDIRRTISVVHKFVAVSHYLQDWTAKRYEIPPEKIVTIPNGADLETFRPRPSYLSAPAPLKTLFIGRIDPDKGPDLAADAVAKLRDEGAAITLTVVGGLGSQGHGDESADPYFRSLKMKMDAAGAEYLGHVKRPDVPPLLRRHDVACILSRANDPLPQTVFEAMASGLAVLASDRGGIPEACDGAGWLVNPDDFDAIVGALRTLATIPPVLNEYKRRSVGRAARASWDVSVDQLERLLGD